MQYAPLDSESFAEIQSRRAHGELWIIEQIPGGSIVSAPTPIMRYRLDLMWTTSRCGFGRCLPRTARTVVRPKSQRRDSLPRLGR
jgi:hypothetical protein